MITGGTAIPGLKYDTRFKTAAEGGDPLYFKPNYQPVIPYPINGVEADTLNKYKFEWSQAKARYGARDEDYVGYYYAPEPGSLYWWDHFMGNTMAMIESTPATLLKGGTNLGGSAAKVLLSSPFGLPMQLTGLLNRVMTEAPESDTGSLLNAMNETTGGYVSAINSLQDIVSEAVEPLEKHAFNTWSADLTDDSFKAKSARAISSGVYSLGLALATNNPSLAFAILNFAETNNMRRNALNYGASPLWSEVYSVGGSSLNTVLDLFGFEALVNSSSLVKIGSKKFYEYLGKKGLLVGVKRHAPREMAATGMEMGTEAAQEFIEGAYDPEYRASPLEASLLAFMGAGALKIATLPISIRNANFDDRMKLA